jgi:hypothetical protein
MIGARAAVLGLLLAAGVMLAVVGAMSLFTSTPRME